MTHIVLILHNVRSCHNVGAMLRTAEGLGVERVYLSGYTPYPLQAGDSRRPYLAQKIDRQIHKTALGAETMLPWQHVDTIAPLLVQLRAAGYAIVALEQAPHATRLPQYAAPEQTALLVGREVEGIEAEVLAQVDTVVEIPMHGQKESFNVASAAAMALYHLTFGQPV